MERSTVDKYIKESCKSFRDANVKNCARRNSLLKKTLGIETERKLVSARLDREEKLLRDQLKTMQLEKTKTAIISHVKVTEDEDAHKERLINVRHIPSEDVNPYPVTFTSSRTPSPRRRKVSYEEKARQHAARRGRRLSKEFEDLHLNTQTGKLAPPKSPLSVLYSPALRRRLEHGSRSSMSSSEDLCSQSTTNTRQSRKKRPDHPK